MTMYHIFYMDKGHTMVFDLNTEMTTFSKLLDLIADEVGIRVSDLIILDENGSAPDSKKNLSELESIGTPSSPVYVFLKSGIDRDNPVASEVTYIFQMLEDALDQANYVLQSNDPLKIYMELPDRAKNCRKITEELLQMCASLVDQHRLLHKGWIALINNLDTSVSKMDKRGKRFKSVNAKMDDLIEKSESLLRNYSDVVEQLRRIEVPPEIYVKSASTVTSTTAPITTDEKCTLYDFIAKADPEGALDNLPDQVNEKIEQLREHNVSSVYTNLKTVLEQSKNPEFRDFKGINKRFSQLEFSLKSCEERKDIISQLVGQILETPKNIDQAQLPAIIEEHCRFMKIIFENFAEFRSMVKVFDQSKQEILTNLRTRMAGFVVQSYDKLRTVHNEIMQYEYKGEAVRMNMDLIGQIRDAPTLYSQSVSEIVRRRLLKAELDEWHLDHSTKCTDFSADEEKSREQLRRKLKKHFLHALFPGLFDNLPEFFVKSPLPNYDADLPEVPKEYIKELREAIPELEPYLKVTLPNVASKLATKGSKPPPFGQTRLESFLTDEPMKMARSHFNYSPAAWLSEDGGDSSPITQPLMCRSPDNMLRESQCRPIPYVPSLQQLEGLDGPISSGTPQSAPINIPHSGSSRVNFKQSGRQMSSQDIHIGSAVSSDTSLLGPETPVKNDTVMQMEKKSETPLQSRLSGSSSDSLDSLLDVYDGLDYAAEDILVGLSDHTAQLEDAVRRLSKMQVLVASMEPRNDKLFKYLHQTAPRDFQLVIHDGDKMKTRVKELGESVENLETQLESMKNTETELEAKMAEMTVQHKQEIENTKAECFKNLSIEFELMSDSMDRQNKELLESKDREIAELKEKLEKAHEKANRTDPYTEEYKKNLTADIRAELEKEFKARIEMITKAVEHKKDEAFAREQKTLEVENRILSSENESKSKKLEAMRWENEELQEMIRQMPDGNVILEEFNALKEGQQTIQLKDKFAAIRSKMDKSLDARCLDSNKVLFIDNWMKVAKIKQLEKERNKYRDIIGSQNGGDLVLKSINETIMAGLHEDKNLMKELTDETGGKVAKILEITMDIVLFQALVRAIPNGPSVGDISTALHADNRQQDVEAVTCLALQNIFVDHDKEDIKKLARCMQMWLNTYVINLTSYGTRALEDSPKVKLCAAKYRSLVMKASVHNMMDESFYQPMASSMLHVANSPSDLSFEVQRTSNNAICTQTRLCMSAMNLLISVQDIKVGSVVLVIWHQIHNAYIIFCSSSTRYFVKESSIKRLGINTADVNTRRNWMISRVVRSDSCSIKKPVNRYNLPMNTIVRRVEVEPVTFDFEGEFNEISIA